MTDLVLDHPTRLKRLRFRAWHRGTREADLMVGGFFDAHHAGWSAAEADWFEALLEEQDVDIIAWALGAQPVPERWQGAMIERMRSLDYVRSPASPSPLREEGQSRERHWMSAPLPRPFPRGKREK